MKKWQENIIDNSRSVWLKIFGIPVMAWHNEFFVTLANSLGKFICVDDRTASGSCFDVARMLVEVPLDFYLQDFYSVEINDKSYPLVLREECGGVCSCSGNHNSLYSNPHESDDSDSVSAGTMGVSEDDIEKFSNSNDTVGYFV